jgi:hypothetical protein
LVFVPFAISGFRPVIASVCVWLVLARRRIRPSRAVLLNLFGNRART